MSKEHILKEAFELCLKLGGHMNENKIEILLVDDDEVDREIIKKALKALEAKFTEAITGKECLEALEKHAFSLILLDYKLPDTTGIELIYSIKKIQPSTPVIIVTGFGNEDLVRATSDAGVLDYIPKNKITPEFLTRTILNDLLIHKTQVDKELMELQMEKQKAESIATFEEIIRLAKQKLADYDK